MDLETLTIVNDGKDRNGIPTILLGNCEIKGIINFSYNAPRDVIDIGPLNAPSQFIMTPSEPVKVSIEFYVKDIKVIRKNPLMVVPEGFAMGGMEGLMRKSMSRNLFGDDEPSSFDMAREMKKSMDIIKKTELREAKKKAKEKLFVIDKRSIELPPTKKEKKK